MNLPLIVIVGETASGKSSLALQLAQAIGGEIIGADSWTVYKDFTIGTAKPSASEQRLVPHHLFDCIDPRDGFNAAQFKSLALSAINHVHERGAIPILVGGTGLYIDSVIFDYTFMPQGSAVDRDRRNSMTREDLLYEASSRNIDLTGIDTRNKRRIIRALETNGHTPKSTELRDNTLVLGIVSERAELQERVSQRVDAMLVAGLEAEVVRLAHIYGWDAEPMKGIGYREWHDYFFSTQSLDVTRSRIISNSMKLAKRQRTWFKRNHAIHWLNKPEDAVKITAAFLNKNQ